MAWSMDAEITPTDGISLRKVRFRNTQLAQDIRVPFFKLETNLMPLLLVCVSELDFRHG